MKILIIPYENPSSVSISIFIFLAAAAALYICFKKDINNQK